MKTFLWVVLGLVAVGVLVFMLGPRIKVDTTIHDNNLPKDLDAYLKKSEAKYTDIILNTEKKIVWFDPAGKSQTDVSIVFIHGFSASRKEFDPLCELLGKELKANVFYTRLRGHGQPGKALANAKVNDWLNDTVEAVRIGRRLGKKVLLVGSSTGATLGLWLATTPHIKDVMGMVLVSPNFQPHDKTARVFLLPWGLHIAQAVAGKTRTWKPLNKAQEKYWTTSYPVRALYQMMG